MTEDIKILIDSIKKHTNILTEEEWLEERRKCFTGTDAATLIGINPYNTPFRLYLTKKEGYETKKTFSMLRGKYLEPLIANLFAEDHPNFEVINLKDEENKECITYHPSYPVIAGSIDRLFIDESGNIGVLEIKTAVGPGVARWEDGPPQIYKIQLQQYLMIVKDIIKKINPSMSDKVYGMFAYSLDDKLEYSLPIYPDPKVHDLILEAIFKYNKIVNVEKRHPDLVDFEDVKLRYNKVYYSDYIEVNEDIVEKLIAFTNLKEKKDVSYKEYVTDIVKQIDDVQKEIIEVIGDYEGLVYEGIIIATRKEDKNGSRRLYVSKKNLNEALSVVSKNLLEKDTGEDLPI